MIEFPTYRYTFLLFENLIKKLSQLLVLNSDDTISPTCKSSHTISEDTN